MLSFLLFICSFFKDIFAIVIKLLRWPLALLAFVWLLGVILSQLWATLSNAFSPFCIIPGISSSPFCSLSDSSALALEIKKSEMAMANLATLVRISKLTNKELLADTLIQFVEEAKVTSRSLQRLSSKVGEAVDTIMAIKDHALRRIVAAHAFEPSRYSLRAFLPGAQTQKKTNEPVLESFNTAMEISSRYLSRLIAEAQALITSLDLQVQERLGTLHTLVAIEDTEIAGTREELLALLWTKLGGNKKALKDAEDQLELLKGVGGYRKRALTHAVGAIQTLQGMVADLEDLRERVAAPELAGDQLKLAVWSTMDFSL